MTPDTTDFNSLSKKQLVELVIAKYNDCFRLEEENKKLKEDYKALGILNDEIRRVNENLREENKKLKEENDDLRCRVDDLQPNYDNRYNLINREREDHQKIMNRLLVNNLILILAVVANFIVLFLK